MEGTRPKQTHLRRPDTCIRPLRARPNSLIGRKSVLAIPFCGSCATNKDGVKNDRSRISAVAGEPSRRVSFPPSPRTRPLPRTGNCCKKSSGRENRAQNIEVGTSSMRASKRITAPSELRAEPCNGAGCSSISDLTVPNLRQSGPRTRGPSNGTFSRALVLPCKDVLS